MTPESVAAASEAWVYVPETATAVETGDYLLVRFPDWFEHPAALLRWHPTREPAVVLDEVLDRARGLGVDRMVAWVTPSAGPDFDGLLEERGAARDEVLDVMALDLAGGPPDLDAGARHLVLRWATELGVARDAEEITVEVFGGSVPPDDELAASLERNRSAYGNGDGGIVVAYDDDRAVGMGGLSLVDGVARLWGGAVREDARGRGVYRALLADRIRYGIDHGAALALVKGRIATSGPILRRAGFTAYGQEWSYVVPL